MKTLFLIFVLFFNCKSQLPPDKIKHAMICEGIVAMQGYTMYSLTDRIDVSLFSAGLTALTIGAGKEIVWDKWMHKGDPSWRDFGADFFGTVKGLIQLRVEIDIEQKNDKTNNYLYYHKYWYDNLGPAQLTPRDL